YPKGTTIAQVETITRGVCEEMFEGEDRRFKYVAAIHDDTDHHPHAHVIVNRRADDNTLFTMRSGTAHSYEGFREAMAEHGARIGVRLDPTFRFERGLVAAQPARDEQLAAQLEGRAPVQRRRDGVALAEQREMIAYSKIAFEAMSVIAHNADSPRLEAAWREIAETLESNAGEVEMPELSRDEMERFDQYTGLLADTIERAERVIETKSAAERAPMERRLDDIMQSFTALSPKASYAKDLHEAPGAATIYMHRLGERGDALASPEVQDRVARVADAYGLDAEAVTARLRTGAESRRLEDVWLTDDLRRVANRAGLDLSDREGQGAALGRLDAAYQELRGPLVKDRVLAVVPHLDDDYAWRPPQAEGYRFDADRLGTDVETVVRHYRENGAPQVWIDANRSQIAND
ncbi:relaxase/mobilization nuclease domain-containing protein, partial [Jannaschia aquimarina]|uniref:relaxase/mobilization nuclease domain-containing protein n=1 Tax=Jannaschia aquimarina TaxID=935700 RepID=UPI000B6819CF